MGFCVDIEKLKKEYIGQIFNYLTVLDVFLNPDDTNRITFKCKCKCGNIKNILKKNVISGHCVSCGCYRKSKEKAQKHSEWYKNNKDNVDNGLLKRKLNYEKHPEKLKQIGIKVSNWYKNHPDKVKEKSDRFSQWCKSNKNKLIEKGKSHSDYLKSHSEVIKQIVEKRKKFYNEQPEKLESVHNNIKKWNENNKEFLKLRGKKRSDWLKDHPEVIENISNKLSKYHRNKKTLVKYDKLIDIIHPRYLDDLFNLELKANSIIETRCQICGEYGKHPYI